jgi:hypothetical protein
MAVLGSCLHRIRASLHIIAQGFGFTRDFLKERNNSAYCRLKKIPCGFKEQARARHPGEKCGLENLAGNKHQWRTHALIPRTQKYKDETND